MGQLLLLDCNYVTLTAFFFFFLHLMETGEGFSWCEIWMAWSLLYDTQRTNT